MLCALLTLFKLSTDIFESVPPDIFESVTLDIFESVPPDVFESLTLDIFESVTTSDILECSSGYI